MNSKKNQRHVIAASGGLDSVVMMHAARAEGVDFSVFHADFGKPSSEMELASLKRTANELRVQTEIVDLSSLTRMQYGYVHPEIIAADEADVKDFEIVARNDVSGFHILMSCAAYFSQISGAKSISFGLIKAQTQRRTSLRENLKVYQDFLAGFNPNADPVEIQAPLIEMEKSEVIKIGSGLDIDFAGTWSCGAVHQDIVHCGVCTQCKNRKEAFLEAAVDDPTTYKE